MLFLVLCILISPIYLATGKESWAFCVTIVIATIVPIACVTIAAKFRLYLAELYLPLSVLSRGLAMYFILKV